MLNESDFYDYRVYLPLYVGAFRWCMFLILRVLPSLFYTQIKPIVATPKNIESGKYQKISKSDVTVVVTIYEPPEGFLPAMKQVRKNGPHKVYVIADVTCYKEVQELLDANDFDRNVFKVICEHKPGKRAALITGIKLSKTKLTLLMDDDSYWTDTFLTDIILPFQHKDIGGVGVKQIAKKKSYWNLTDILADMRLSVRYLELRATTTVDRGCSCISGRTGCYLTSLINTPECMHEFENEKFFGMQTLSGDDKFMTRWVVNNGYKTYHQLYNTCKLTTTFDSGSKLFKQLFRWSRNTWRSDIKNLFFERKIWYRCPFTAICMFDKILTPFFLLFGPIYVTILFFIRGFNTVEILGYAIWLLFSRAVRLCYHFYENPHHIIYLPFFVIFQYVQGLIRIYALFTLHDYAWGTRKVTVGKDGKCIRTGDLAEDKESLLEGTRDEDLNDTSSMNSKIRHSRFPTENTVDLNGLPIRAESRLSVLSKKFNSSNRIDLKKLSVKLEPKFTVVELNKLIKTDHRQSKVVSLCYAEKIDITELYKRESYCTTTSSNKPTAVYNYTAPISNENSLDKRDYPTSNLRCTVCNNLTSEEPTVMKDIDEMLGDIFPLNS
jgi:glycosyltransferase involved in cell wall biosynthesis